MRPELKKLTCLSTILKEGLSFSTNLCSFSKVSLAVWRTLLLILFFLEPMECSGCSSPGREQSWRAAGSGGMNLLSHCETELEGAGMRGRGMDLAAAAG